MTRATSSGDILANIPITRCELLHAQLMAFGPYFASSLSSVPISGLSVVVFLFPQLESRAAVLLQFDEDLGRLMTCRALSAENADDTLNDPVDGFSGIDPFLDRAPVVFRPIYDPCSSPSDSS